MSKIFYIISFIFISLIIFPEILANGEGTETAETTTNTAHESSANGEGTKTTENTTNTAHESSANGEGSETIETTTNTANESSANTAHESSGTKTTETTINTANESSANVDAADLLLQKIKTQYENEHGKEKKVVLPSQYDKYKKENKVIEVETFECQAGDKCSRDVWKFFVGAKEVDLTINLLQKRMASKDEDKSGGVCQSAYDIWIHLTNTTCQLNCIHEFCFTYLNTNEGKEAQKSKMNNANFTTGVKDITSPSIAGAFRNKPVTTSKSETKNDEKTSDSDTKNGTETSGSDTKNGTKTSGSDTNNGTETSTSDTKNGTETSGSDTKNRTETSG